MQALGAVTVGVLAFSLMLYSQSPIHQLSGGAESVDAQGAGCAVHAGAQPVAGAFTLRGPDSVTQSRNPSNHTSNTSVETFTDGSGLRV